MWILDSFATCHSLEVIHFTFSYHSYHIQLSGINVVYVYALESIVFFLKIPLH